MASPERPFDHQNADHIGGFQGNLKRPETDLTTADFRQAVRKFERSGTVDQLSERPAAKRLPKKRSGKGAALATTAALAIGAFAADKGIDRSVDEQRKVTGNTPELIERDRREKEAREFARDVSQQERTIKQDVAPSAAVPESPVVKAPEATMRPNQEYGVPIDVGEPQTEPDILDPSLTQEDTSIPTPEQPATEGYLPPEEVSRIKEELYGEKQSGGADLP